jgi:hypothetical protein
MKEGCFSMCFCRDMLPSPESQSNVVAHSQIGTSITISQNKHFSVYKLIALGFSSAKLANTQLIKFGFHHKMISLIFFTRQRKKRQSVGVI